MDRRAILQVVVVVQMSGLALPPYTSAPAPTMVQPSALYPAQACPPQPQQQTRPHHSVLAAAGSLPSAGLNGELQPKVEAGTEDVKEDVKDESPEVDIVINNVVCSFSVRCHLNLKEIALNGSNVEYRRENGMVTMKLRHPYTTASIWSSGKITCTGANSEEQARISARKFSRILQKLDEKYANIRIKNWRIVNVLGTCTLPFAIKITPFSQAFKEASYEPELHPGVTYKIKHPKATLKIFSTGSITVTAPSVANVQSAIEHIYPKVFEFQKKKEKVDIEAELKFKSEQGVKRKGGPGNGLASRKTARQGASHGSDEDLSD